MREEKKEQMKEKKIKEPVLNELEEIQELEAIVKFWQPVL